LESLENGYLASGSYDTTIKIWDVTLGKLKLTLNRQDGGHLYPLYSIISLNNDLFASVSTSDYSICVWDVRNGKLKFKFLGYQGTHSNQVNKMTLLSNGYMATGSYDNTFKIWDLNKQLLLFTGNETIGGHSDWVTDLVEFNLNQNESYLATSSFDKSIKIWKLIE
jgi:WD40 repeat protein